MQRDTSIYILFDYNSCFVKDVGEQLRLHVDKTDIVENRCRFPEFGLAGRLGEAAIWLNIVYCSSPPSGQQRW